MKDKINSNLEKAYEKSKSHEFSLNDWEAKAWEEMRVSDKFGKMKDTGVNIEHLKDIGLKITTLPSDYKFHPQISKIYDLRRKSIEQGKGIDWGTAEALAFASLMDEGFHVRLSG